MDADPSRVIVSWSGSRATASVHHRAFAEIRAEGPSPKDAAAHLMNKLSRTLDSALTDWRREILEQAMADVKAFLEQAQ